MAQLNLDPVKASTLLALEEAEASAIFTTTSSRSQSTGIWVRGLDTRFRPLWVGGRVIGIGTTGAEDDVGLDKTSLSLHVVASALMHAPMLSYIQNISTSAQTSSSGVPPVPTTYIVAPHTYQTTPLLHACLAKALPDPATAIDLLNSVQVLQYFDLAGLADALTEVSGGIYRRNHLESEQHPANDGTSSGLKDLVLVQGIAQTIAVTHRRSGIVQANALLSGLARNIVQLSRISRDVLVVVDCPVEIDIPSGESNPRKFVKGVELESAFSSPSGETLRLVCGHETLSRTLHETFDCIVAVHDGFGKLNPQTKRPSGQRERVVEVVKDRIGDLMGSWAVHVSYEPI